MYVVVARLIYSFFLGNKNLGMRWFFHNYLENKKIRLNQYKN